MTQKWLLLERKITIGSNKIRGAVVNISSTASELVKYVEEPILKDIVLHLLNREMESNAESKLRKHLALYSFDQLKDFIIDKQVQRPFYLKILDFGIYQS